MKKLLIVLSMIISGLVIIFVTGICIVALKGKSLDGESKAYVDEIVPVILSNLNKDTLFKYSSQDLIKSASDEDFDRLFRMFKKLGQFKEYKESKGQAGIHYNFKNKIITAEYMTKVEFEVGPATVYIGLIKKDKKWFIQVFRIDSKVFM